MTGYVARIRLRRGAVCIAAAAFVFARSLFAFGQEPVSSPPEPLASDKIRSWGSAQMTDLLRLWEQGFHEYHPAILFDDNLKGTVSGMGGLYSGVIDLSVMGREIWPAESMAYEQATGHSPEGVQVAVGSYDVPTKADALVVFVHRTNPLATLSFPQLQYLFGSNSAVGGCIPRWGDLGVAGAWSAKPIHAYGYKLDNAAAIFFKNRVLKDSEWRCGIKTYANQINPDGTRIDSGKLILESLKTDPYGIAISNPHYANSEVKALAISMADHSSAVLPSRESVASGKYPLARGVYIFFNRQKDGNLRPVVREFLRYVLSNEGQRQVPREGDYLPLPENSRQEQLQKIR